MVFVVTIISFAIFRAFVVQQESLYATEIAAAFVGTLLTVIVTSMLLKQQTTSELDKEKNVVIYDTKVKNYEALMQAIEDILIEEELKEQHTIRLQILFQRVAFVASEGVLEKLRDFAKIFSEAAQDGSISRKDRNTILTAFGNLTVEIRADLNPQTEAEKQRVAQIVTENIAAIPMKTEEQVFLSKCDEEESEYYAQILKHLKNRGIEPNFGKEGISIRGKNIPAGPVVQLYPSSSRKSILILPRQSSPQTTVAVQQILQSHAITGMGFKPGEMPVEDTIKVIDILISA